MPKLKTLQLENLALREQIASLEAQLAETRPRTDKSEEAGPAQFQVLFESLEVGVVYQAADGSITLANPAAARILGLEPDEIQGRKSLDPRRRAIHPDGSAFPEEQHPALEALQTGKVVKDVVMGVYRPCENEYRWIMITAVPEFHTGEERPYRVYTIFADITETERAKEKLRHAQSFLQGAQDALTANIAILDEHGVIVQVNSGWSQFGDTNGLQTADHCLGTNYLQVCDSATGADASEAQTMAQAIRAVLAGEQAEVEIEYPCHSPTQKRWFLGRIAKFTTGNQTWVVLAHENITELKTAQNNLRELNRSLEERVQERTAEAHDLYDNAPAGYHSVDENGLIILVNQTELDWLGYTREELVGIKHYRDLLTSQSQQRFDEYFPRLKAQGRIIEQEIEIIRKDGSLLLVVLNGSAIYAADGKFVQSRSSIIDITERKQVEEALRESDTKFSAAFNLSPLCLEIATLEGKIVEVNQTFSDLLGLSREAMIGKDNAELGSRVVFDQEIIGAQIAHSGGILRNLEARFRARDGSLHNILFSTNPITLRGVPHLLFAGVDITERKQAEIALHESEEKYRAIIETSPDAIGLFGVGGVVLAMNPAAAITFGYASSVEMIGKNALEFFLPEDQEKAADMIQQVLTSGAVQNVEFRLLKKDGSWFCAEFSCSALYAADGKPKGIVAVTRDITQRQQAEAALQDSNETAQAIMNSITDILFLMEVDGTLLAANETVAAELGKSVKDYTGVNMYAHIPAVVAAARKEQVAAVVREHRPAFFEDERSGRWDENRVYPVIDNAGQVRRVVIYGRDVTERKRMEAALRDSHEIARAIINSATDGIFLIETNGKVLAANETVAARLGVSIANLIGSTIYDHLPAEMAAARKEHVAAVVRARKPVFFEDERFGLWQENRIYPVTDSDGQVRRVAVYWRDITERKQAEAALRLSEEKYRGLMESLDSAVVTVDAAGCLLYLNDRAARLFGDTAEKLVGKTMRAILPEPGATAALEFVRRAILTDQKSVAEFQTPIMGEPRWFRIAIQPIHGVNEQVTHALINATDINDLKTAQQKLMELNQTLEERIKQRSAEVQDLYDNAPAGYHSLDKDGLFVMINQTELNWLGYTREEILGVKNFRDLQSTESQQIFDESFQILMEQGWIKDIEFEVLRKDGSRMPVLLSKYSKEIISGGTLLA